MKKIISLIFTILLTTIQLKANQPRTLTVYGKVDPRLYVWIQTTYRSMNPNDLRQNYKECTQSNWNTGGRKRTLNWDVKHIIPDKNNNYKVTIPIDYVNKNRCGFEYVSTRIVIRRDKKDERYAKIEIANNRNKANNIYIGYKGGMQGMGQPKGTTTTKNHYQLSSGSKIECYTIWYEDSKHIESNKAHANFTCLPIPLNDINGVDELKTDTINIDIVINEDKCKKAQKSKDGSYKDNFRDYEIKYINTFHKYEVQFKQYIKNLFN